MSRTIKIHGCMSHIVSQMRRIPCGLSDFDENFMEQYHQKGAGYDVRLKHVKNVEKKGNIVAARLRRSEHPETRAAIQRMVEQHSKGTSTSEKLGQNGLNFFVFSGTTFIQVYKLFVIVSPSCL